MVFKSHSALRINILVNMHCKVLSQVTFFIRSYKACWFLENDVDNDMPFFFALRSLFFFLYNFFFFFYLCIYFNWRLITLQYCSGFCHIFTWISHGCTCVPHPEPPPTSLPISSLRVITVHQPWAPCLMHRTWTGDLFHIW